MSRPSSETVSAGLRAAIHLKEGHLPAEADLQAAPLLSGWALVAEPPSLHRLVGVVSGHPIIADGWCTTSVVLVIDPQRQWARTISRLYRLKQPLEDSKRATESIAF